MKTIEIALILGLLTAGCGGGSGGGGDIEDKYNPPVDVPGGSSVQTVIFTAMDGPTRKLMSYTEGEDLKVLFSDKAEKVMHSKEMGATLFGGDQMGNNYSDPYLYDHSTGETYGLKTRIENYSATGNLEYLPLTVSIHHDEGNSPATTTEALAFMCKDGNVCMAKNPSSGQWKVYREHIGDNAQYVGDTTVNYSGEASTYKKANVPCFKTSDTTPRLVCKSLRNLYTGSLITGADYATVQDHSFTGAVIINHVIFLDDPADYIVATTDGSGNSSWTLFRNHTESADIDAINSGDANISWIIKGTQPDVVYLNAMQDADATNKIYRYEINSGYFELMTDVTGTTYVAQNGDYLYVREWTSGLGSEVKAIDKSTGQIDVVTNAPGADHTYVHTVIEAQDSVYMVTQSENSSDYNVVSMDGITEEIMNINALDNQTLMALQAQDDEYVYINANSSTKDGVIYKLDKHSGVATEMKDLNDTLGSSPYIEDFIIVK